MQTGATVPPVMLRVGGGVLLELFNQLPHIPLLQLLIIRPYTQEQVVAGQSARVVFPRLAVRGPPWATIGSCPSALHWWAP